MKEYQIPPTPWREILVEMAEEHFPPEEKIHGLRHTKEVERLAFKIAQEPEYAHFSFDPNVLSAAALLHDVGHSQKKEDWSDDGREHVSESVRVSEKMLRKIPYFMERPQKTTQTLHLILNHDNTNYLFPIKGRGGRPAITKEWVVEAEQGWDENDFWGEELAAMLAILKEADGLLGTGKKGAQRVLTINLAKGVPIFAQGDPLRAWMWGESVMGSIRLSAKRALLDAKTKKGRELAWQGYLEAEEVVKRECERNGVPYQPELGLEGLNCLRDREKISGYIEITKIHPWEELEGILRQVPLQGDATLFPYVTARIESQALETRSVAPLSLYAVSGQLEFHRKLRELFLANYALDLLDLSGIIEFKTEEGQYRISPPIVEISKPDENKSGLVDGVHRYLLAESIGYSRVRTIVITGIPDHFPLVPKILDWDSVAIYDRVPREAKKRRYRFPDLKSFPDISWFSDVEVTEDNCRYFFFRDLSSLGSSGIRKPEEEV